MLLTNFSRLITLAAVLGMTLSSAHANDVKQQRHLWELGFFIGAFFPPEDHELHNPDVAHEPFEKAAVDIGVRVAYLPIPYLGIEAEGAVMPTKTSTTGTSALVYGVRGHAIIQYPSLVAPFLVVGGGLLGVHSSRESVGRDVDGAFHWGAGVKWYANDWLLLRLDGRHNISGKKGPGGNAHYFEALAGLSFLLNWRIPDRDGDGVPDSADSCPDKAARTPDGCPLIDTDGDGIPDGEDKCPTRAATTTDGCPPDTDGDGVADDLDRCPSVAAQTADGCPLKDTDNDGIPDEQDKCPERPAKTADGCPPDSDGDGIADDKDQCPDKPETKNGFRDKDGCPDELPKRVKRFTGTIRGINFGLNSARIRRGSYRTLNAAAKVLKDYPSLSLRIRGHSDSTGKRAYNLELSGKRAEAVKDYLVAQGVDTQRLETAGVGPDEPIGNNRLASGRALNRRIEFQIIKE